MALAGEKVGIPTADEAPMVVMARYKQPLAASCRFSFNYNCFHN